MAVFFENTENLEEWAKDWITLWQSELTALAADRELREGWMQLMALWAGAASQAAEMAIRAARSHERPPRFSPGHDRTDDAPRAASAAAAPDAGGGEVQRLHQRIAALEARLLAVERGGT